MPHERRPTKQLNNTAPVQPYGTVAATANGPTFVCVFHHLYLRDLSAQYRIPHSMEWLRTHLSLREGVRSVPDKT